MKVKISDLIIVGISIIILVINHICLFQHDEIRCIANSEIAKGVVELESSEKIDKEVNRNIFPIEYDFKINNYKENIINEVDFDYIIKIENSSENFPVSYTLWDCDNQNEIPIIDGNSESMKINKFKKESRNSKLYMQWRELEGELADNTEIKIKIEAIQTRKEIS